MLVKRIWMDNTDGEPIDPLEGNADVMVEMENGELWTAHFVTTPYLRQQIAMSVAVAKLHSELGRVGYVALETPHVIVEKITPEGVEDVVDNLMILGTFESVFDLVIDTPEVEENS